MKKKILLVLTLVAISFMSCESNDDSDYAEYLVARPLVISKAELTTVDIIAPTPIN